MRWSAWRRWRELSTADQLYYLRAYRLGRRTLWDDAPADRPAFLDRLAPARALDAGCGAGRNAIALAQRGWSVVGLDLHAVALDRARARAAGQQLSLEWVQGPATAVDALAPPRFGLVLDVFGPASDLPPAGRSAYAAALIRAMEPDGVLAVFTFEPPAAMAPFLSAFAVDHALAQVAPSSPAGRWWVMRPR